MQYSLYSCELVDVGKFWSAQAGRNRVHVILIPPEQIISERQIALALALTIRDFRQKTNRAKKFPMQFLMRLLAADQIKDVVEKVSISEGREYAVVVFQEDESQVDLEEWGLKCQEMGIIEVGDPCGVARLYGWKCKNIRELATKFGKSLTEMLEMLILEEIALAGLRL